MGRGMLLKNVGDSNVLTTFVQTKQRLTYKSSRVIIASIAIPTLAVQAFSMLPQLPLTHHLDGFGLNTRANAPPDKLCTADVE
jgi:hypothetical protein